MYVCVHVYILLLVSHHCKPHSAFVHCSFSLTVFLSLFLETSPDVPCLLPGSISTSSMLNRDLLCPCTSDCAERLCTLRFCAGSRSCSGTDFCFSQRVVHAPASWNAAEIHGWSMHCRVSDEHLQLNEKQL